MTLAQSRRRDAQARSSVIAGIAFQASYVLAQFVILAVLFRAVDHERFGMWVTVFGLTMWLTLLPLGMHRAVLTWLGRAAYNQPAMVWRVVKAALAVTMLTSGLAAVLLVLLGGWVPWAQVLNVTAAQATADARPTAVAALVMMALAMPAAMGGMVLQALQRGTARHVLGIVAQAGGLGLLLLGVWRGWPLPVLGVLIVSPIMIAGLLQWAAAWRAMPRPPAKPLHPEHLVRPMLATGIGLWLIELALVLTVNSGPLLVAQFSGAAAVAPYAAVYRLVGPLIVSFMVMAQAYWPAFGDAAGAADHAWIGRALRRSAGLSLALWAAGAIACLAIGRPFIVWWLGAEAEPDVPMILAGLGFALAHGLYYWTVAALNGLGQVRVQVAASLSAVAGYAVAAWLLSDVLGAAGVFVLQAGAVGLVGAINAVSLARMTMRRPC